MDLGHMFMGTWVSLESFPKQENLMQVVQP